MDSWKLCFRALMKEVMCYRDAVRLPKRTNYIRYPDAHLNPKMNMSDGIGLSHEYA